jgi:hypothetical protein
MNMFQEESGHYSMRRILAFIFGLVSCTAGIIAVVKQSEWLAIAASFGAPGVLSLGYLILTTVTDVKAIISTARGINDAR